MEQSKILAELEDEFEDEFEAMMASIHDKSRPQCSNALGHSIKQTRTEADNLKKANSKLGGIFGKLGEAFVGKRDLMDERDAVLGDLTKITAELDTHGKKMQNLHDDMQRRDQIMISKAAKVQQLRDQQRDQPTRQQKKLEALQSYPFLTIPQSNAEAAFLSDDHFETFRLVDKIINPYFSAHKQSPTICVACYKVFGDSSETIDIPCRISDNIPLAFAVEEFFGSSHLSTVERRSLLDSSVRMVNLVQRKPMETRLRLPLVLMGETSILKHPCYSTQQAFFMTRAALLQRMHSLEINHIIHKLTSSKPAISFSQSQGFEHVSTNAGGHNKHPASSAVSILTRLTKATTNANQKVGEETKHSSTSSQDDNPALPDDAGGIPQSEGVNVEKAEAFLKGNKTMLITQKELALEAIQEDLKPPHTASALKLTYGQSEFVYLTTKNLVKCEWVGPTPEKPARSNNHVECEHNLPEQGSSEEATLVGPKHTENASLTTTLTAQTANPSLSGLELAEVMLSKKRPSARELSPAERLNFQPAL